MADTGPIVWFFGGCAKAAYLLTGMRGNGPWTRGAFWNIRSSLTQSKYFTSTDVLLPDYPHQINIRIWTPTESKITGSKYPVVIFLHGGGFTIGHGNDQISDMTCKKLVLHGFLTASIDYRLSPEFPFPAAVEDCNSAVQFILKGGLGDKADLSNVILMGDSAGGNLSAVVSMLARDRNSPEEAKIKWQVLVYPAFFMQTESKERLRDAWLIPHDVLDWFHRQYLPPNGDINSIDPSQRYKLNPMLSENGLIGLPNTLIITGELCPLQDEGIEYAKKLREANVNVVHEHIKGLVHGGMSFPTKESDVLWKAIFKTITSPLSSNQTKTTATKTEEEGTPSMVITTQQSNSSQSPTQINEIH